MDQQIKEHEHQLVVLQGEIQKKNTAIKPHPEMAGKEGPGPRDLPSTPPVSGVPLQRWTQEPQPSEERWQRWGAENVQKEVQGRPSGAPVEKEKIQQCYSEYFSQTSTELQITFDETNPIARLSEIEKLRDQALCNSRPAIRCQDDKYEIDLVTLLAPFEVLPGFWDFYQLPSVKFSLLFPFSARLYSFSHIECDWLFVVPTESHAIIF